MRKELFLMLQIRELNLCSTGVSSEGKVLESYFQRMFESLMLRLPYKSQIGAEGEK